MTDVYAEKQYRDAKEQQQAEDVGYNRVQLRELIRYAIEHHLPNKICHLLAGVLRFVVLMTEFTSKFALTTVQLQTEVTMKGDDTKSICSKVLKGYNCSGHLE